MPNNRSGNNLSDIAPGKIRSGEAKGQGQGPGQGQGQSSSGQGSGGGSNSGGNSGSGGPETAIEDAYAQQEHRDDMLARRKLWQEEVEFHEASVRRQRTAMIKDKEKMDAEHESVRLQLNVSGGGGGSGSGSNSGDAPSSPNAISDLRYKLRDLESEMEDMKRINLNLEEQLIAVQRTAQRDKEVPSTIILVKKKMTQIFLFFHYFSFL